MQKQKRAFIVGLIVVMMASMVAIAANVASAQQADIIAPTKVEFVGTVEAVDATTVTVNGHVITLATAEVQGTLTIGSIVKVEAIVDAGGNFNATEVKPVTEADRGPQELELHGQVSAINGTMFTVAGLTFSTLNAKIEGNPQVGDQVEVKLILSNGELVASKVQTHVEDNGIITGNDTLGNDTLFGNDTLGNDTLLGNEDNGNDLNDDNDDDLGNDTLIGNDDNGNDLGNENNDVVGNDDNGNDVVGNDDNGNDVFGNDTLGNDDNGNHLGEDARLVGTLEQVGDGFIVVNGQQITIVNANVETGLIVGSTVSVEVTNVGGVLTASEVKNAADDHSGQGNDTLFGNDDNGNDTLFGNEDNGNDTVVGNDDNGNDTVLGGNSGSGGGCGSHDGWSEYHVRSGDTLSGIASRSGGDMNEIASSNCIDNPNHVRSGDVILVPNGSTLDTEANDDNGNSGHGNAGGNDNSSDNSDLTGANNDNGGQGNDDGIGHDANDDNGGLNSGNGGQGNDDGIGHDANDDHGGNSGSDDGGNSGNSGSGNSGSGSSGGNDDSSNHDSGDDHGGNSGSSGGDSGSGHGGHGGDDGGGGND